MPDKSKQVGKWHKCPSIQLSVGVVSRGKDILCQIGLKQRCTGPTSWSITHNYLFEIFAVVFHSS